MEVQREKTKTLTPGSAFFFRSRTARCSGGAPLSRFPGEVQEKPEKWPMFQAAPEQRRRRRGFRIRVPGRNRRQSERNKRSRPATSLLPEPVDVSRAMVHNERTCSRQAGCQLAHVLAETRKSVTVASTLGPEHGTSFRKTLHHSCTTWRFPRRNCRNAEGSKNPRCPQHLAVTQPDCPLCPAGAIPRSFQRGPYRAGNDPGSRGRHEHMPCAAAADQGLSPSFR
jgi:hypothetical protein